MPMLSSGCFINQYIVVIVKIIAESNIQGDAFIFMNKPNFRFYFLLILLLSLTL